MTAVDLNAILEQRGIASAAQDANWTPYTFSGLQGWRYPVFDADGKPVMNGTGPVYRWKCAEPETPENTDRWKKYTWLHRYEHKPTYYLLPDTISAIHASFGNVYLASGEPDVLAYRAAGFRNALCALSGEKHIPPTFADDLKAMGVRQVIYYPDRDAAGMKAAVKVRAALKDRGINLQLRQLPGEMGSKMDTNKLWQSVQFDSLRFDSALLDCEHIPTIDLDLYEASEIKPVRLPADGAQGEHDYASLPQRFRDDIRRYVESRPKLRNGSNGWVNFCCPFHDDTRPSAGFNFEVGAFSCFGNCDSMNAKEFGERIGIRLEDYFEPYIPAAMAPAPSTSGTQTAATPTPGQTPAAQPRIEIPPLYEDSHTVTQGLIEELMGSRIPTTEPMAFPFKTFHRFGGFAELMWPGKLIYISGVSGGGKTSLGETFAEGLLRNGDDVIWYGPEWSPEEMKIRSLQRAGGLTLVQFGHLRVWNLDAHKQIPAEDRRGKSISEAEKQHNLELLNGMLGWPGRSYYLRQDARLNSMQAIVDTVTGIVLDKRRAGRKVKALFFDYIQRAPKAGMQGWDAFEKIAGEIKSLCERLELFGFVFLQPTKGDSQSTRSGTELTEASGQGISDQQANLYFTMTPAFDDTKQKLPYVRVNIVKNSAGRTGKMNLKWAGAQLAIVDEEAPDYVINNHGKDIQPIDHFADRESVAM